MVRSCVYCKSEYTLHSFPLKEPEKLQKWIDNLGIPDLKVTNNTRICSNHFEQKYLRFENGKAHLQPGSVPTLFGEMYSACAYCKVKRGEDERKFHRFPVLRETVLQKWLNNFPRKNFQPSEKSVLCSNHFEKSCYYSKGQLKPDAVPTIFQPPMPAANGNTNGAALVEELEMKVEATSEVPKNHEAPPPKRPKLDEQVTENNNNIKNSDSPASESTLNVNSPSVLLTPRSVHSTRSRIILQDHKYANSPTTALKKLRNAEKKIHLQEKIIRAQKMKINRMTTKLTTLMDIVRDLKENNRISSKKDCVL